MNHDFIITSHNGCGEIRIWCGRQGWILLPTESGRQPNAWILNGLSQKYKNVRAVQRAIGRMNAKCPNTILTKNAGYLTRDEAWLDGGHLNVPLLLGQTHEA